MNKSTVKDKLTLLEERLTMLENKHKKPYSSKTITTGDPQLNIDHFNKELSGKASRSSNGGYLNGTIQPDPTKVGGAEAAAKAVGTFASQSPDGASSISTGGESSGGEGGCCEGLEEATHAKLAKPEGDRVTSYNNALAYANKYGKPFIYGYTNRRYNGKFFAFPQPIKCVKDVADCEREFRNRYKDCDVMYVAYPKSARADHNIKQNAYDPVTTNEALELNEAKRYVRRYYIRPQNIFCSNKDEIIKALIDHEDENCSVYTLNNLGDVKDVTKLTNKDIIYYYDDGKLYDKNHVKVMDYDLYIKHEEKRDDINPEQVSDAKFNDVYNDRMTELTVVENLKESQSQEISNSYKQLSKVYNVDLEELVYGEDGFMNSVYPSGFPDFAGDVIYSEKYWDEFEKWLKDAKGVELKQFDDEFGFDLDFDDVNVYGESLKEGKETGGICCICGEPIEGYGNNAEPYKEGRCCDACNMHFVIPARMQQLK